MKADAAQNRIGPIVLADQITYIHELTIPKLASQPKISAFVNYPGHLVNLLSKVHLYDVSPG